METHNPFIRTVFNQNKAIQSDYLSPSLFSTDHTRKVLGCEFLNHKNYLMVQIHFY
jgi:hypothetical protein